MTHNGLDMSSCSVRYLNLHVKKRPKNSAGILRSSRNKQLLISVVICFIYYSLKNETSRINIEAT